MSLNAGSGELEAIREMLAALDLSAMTLEEQRDAFEAGASADGGEAREVGGVPCEWVRSRATPTCKIVAVRGGGYCLGSLGSNRRFAGLLAQACDANVLNVGYRNAPEHPFPAALHDVLAAYRGLLAGGADHADVAFVGNSAGGGLTLACLLALRDAGDPLPACAAVLSPWTDLANTSSSVRTNAPTEMLLDPAALDTTAGYYAPADRLTDPYVSPLYADPTGLPPLLVHVSAAEILLDDSLRLVERYRRAGVDVTLHVEQHVPHVWHLFAGLLREADDALTRLGLWLHDHMP
jgi:acetyl esterase/lipase